MGRHWRPRNLQTKCKRGHNTTNDQDRTVAGGCRLCYNLRRQASFHGMKIDEYIQEKEKGASLDGSSLGRSTAN